MIAIVEQHPVRTSWQEKKHGMREEVQTQREKLVGRCHNLKNDNETIENPAGCAWEGETKRNETNLLTN